MDFKEELKKLVEAIPGAGGAALMGVDGIPIEVFTKNPQTNLELLGAEYALIYKDTHRAGQDFQVGALYQVWIKTAKEAVLLGGLNEDYFVVVQLAPGTIRGKASFSLQQVIPQFQSEL